jgi:hypothetical protein
MILDDPQVQFVMLFSHQTYYGNDPGAYIRYRGKRLTNREYMEHWGKLIVLDEKEELEKLANKLDPLVERGIIPCIKYDRMPLKEFDMKECVMCVFCDDREKDEISEMLASFGATTRAWVPEKDVIQGWSPGGMFLEKWIEAMGYEGEMAEAVREDSRRIMQQAYGDEDALAVGWDQWGSSFE